MGCSQSSMGVARGAPGKLSQNSHCQGTKIYTQREGFWQDADLPIPTNDTMGTPDDGVSHQAPDTRSVVLGSFRVVAAALAALTRHIFTPSSRTSPKLTTALAVGILRATLDHIPVPQLRLMAGTHAAQVTAALKDPIVESLYTRVDRIEWSGSVLKDAATEWRDLDRVLVFVHGGA